MEKIKNVLSSIYFWIIMGFIGGVFLYTGEQLDNNTILMSIGWALFASSLLVPAIGMTYSLLTEKKNK